MKAVFTKTLTNNVYAVELSITEIETTDTDLFADFGEPSIDIGGEIRSGSDIVATLPSQFRKVQSQMPVTMRFADSQYSNNAKAVAEAWLITVEGRINTAMTALRGKMDDFSGTQESVI
jgi:hypothetical protein